MKMSSKCTACCGSLINRNSFGVFPPSNLYQSCAELNYPSHNLETAICSQCGLVQLFQPMPTDMVKPNVDWIRYLEPEAHLDKMVEDIMLMVDLPKDAQILGVTYKDQSTLDRFERAGFKNVYCLQAHLDLAISEQNYGLETIQQYITKSRAKKISEDSGQYDLIVCRHLLEHCHDLSSFVQACQLLCKADGYMAFEVPDNSKIFQSNSHFFLWEEHISYFTEATLSNCFRKSNHLDGKTFRYTEKYEDLLVQIVQNTRKNDVEVDFNLEREIELYCDFISSFEQTKSMWQDYLDELKKSYHNIGLIGAGHLSIKFLNIYELGNYIDFIIDDMPNKQLMYLPQNNLQIIGSEHIESMPSCVLFSSLNPSSLEQYIQKHSKIIPLHNFKTIYSQFG